VLPGARSDWAEAMRHEIAYIEDDAAALRWAVGCVSASYAARLAALAQRHWRVSPGPVVAGSALLLMAMALQGHASDQATPPARDETNCELPAVSPEIQPSQGRDNSEMDRLAVNPTPCFKGHATMRNGRWNGMP
jgi:hypothetical protein